MLRKCSIRQVNSLLSLQPQPPLKLPVLPEEEEEIQGVRWCRCYFDRLRFYQNAEWLFLAGSLSTGRRKKVVAWALRVLSLVVTEVLLYSQLAVMSESLLLLKNATPRSSECLVVWWSYKGANICVQKKKKRNHWKRHRFEWVFIETEVSKAKSPPAPPLQSRRVQFNGSGFRLQNDAPLYSQRPSPGNNWVSQKSSVGVCLLCVWCFLWALQCVGAGESVCQSISRSISLLRERGVCVVLRQQHWAQTRPRTREKRPTPGDTGRGETWITHQMTGRTPPLIVVWYGVGDCISS